MQAMALLIAGIISATIFVALAASWQFVVAFLMGLGLSQEVAAIGPIPTVMLIGLAIDWYRGTVGKSGRAET